MSLKNILFTTVAGIEVALGDEKCHVTLSQAALLGDVNGDGKTDVADVSILINKVLGKSVIEIDETVADLNGDGKIDVADVSALINKVLGK